MGEQRQQAEAAPLPPTDCCRHLSSSLPCMQIGQTALHVAALW
jgi:hypothetical protein